jgi:NAD(P)-dependent dehydrogenase (short-subunit alcohol dehydrogenase family)
MKIVVVGATGTIGAKVVESLSSRHEVVTRKATSSSRLLNLLAQAASSAASLGSGSSARHRGQGRSRGPGDHPGIVRARSRSGRRDLLRRECSV